VKPMIGKDLWWADLIRRAETEQTTAEAAVRRIMGDALSGLVPKYRSEDGFVRWGLVEREIVEVVSSLRARLAEMSGLYENAERVGQGLVARLAESTSRCAALEKVRETAATAFPVLKELFDIMAPEHDDAHYNADLQKVRALNDAIAALASCPAPEGEKEGES
jgi:hypothetical protein